MGDSIRLDLDNELVTLNDKLRDMIFPDTSNYYRQLKILPIFVQSAGTDSDDELTAELFSEFLSDEHLTNMPNFYRYLYLNDCKYLIGTLQNLLDGIDDAFTTYFVRICDISITNANNPNATYWEVSAKARGISAQLESYFTKAYSILDILCKVSFEIECFAKEPNREINSHLKLKSTKILWGDKKRLSLNNSADTIFEDCDLLRTIVSLRNEAVHNGSWELHPKVFLVYEDGRAVERFMRFPDLQNGRLSTVKNHRHFFGHANKVNELLPEIHTQFLHRVNNTIKLLNSSDEQQSNPQKGCFRSASSSSRVFQRP